MQPLSQSSRVYFHLWNAFAQPHGSIIMPKRFIRAESYTSWPLHKNLRIWKPLILVRASQSSQYRVFCPVIITQLWPWYLKCALSFELARTQGGLWGNLAAILNQTNRPWLESLVGNIYAERFKLPLTGCVPCSSRRCNPATAQIDAGQIPLRSSDQTGFQLVFASIPSLGVLSAPQDVY